MSPESKTIIVPWDFTEIAENALAHAVKFAKILQHEITLYHVAKKLKENDDVEKKLTEIASKYSAETGVKISAVVRDGNIFDAIKDLANELGATLVVMGTHGMKGMQKLTGSWALKVMVGSKAPFLVIQEPPKHENLRDIVFPIEFKFEDKEKLRWANYLANFYKVKIQICTPKIKDESLKKKTQSNVLFARKYLESKNILYDITELDGKDFSLDTISFAEKINASMILIMTTPNISFSDYAFGATEQKIIANDAKIPVMCINPREDLLSSEGFHTSGY